MKPEVMRTFNSPSGLYRAEVIRRPTGGFQVEVSRWTVESVPGHGTVHEGWTPIRDGLTLADSIERAAILAAEALLAFD
jgi:hypothetical protein